MTCDVLNVVILAYPYLYDNVLWAVKEKLNQLQCNFTVLLLIMSYIQYFGQIFSKDLNCSPTLWMCASSVDCVPNKD